MTLISFIIPCGRIPFHNAGRHTVDSILDTHLDCEILISSKEFIDYRNCKFHQESETNIGAVEPINQMARAASREFVCLLNDDVCLKDNITPAIIHMLKYNYIGLTLMPLDWKRTGYGHIPGKSLSEQLNIPNTPFPIVRREFISKNKNLLYSEFNHHYADCALSLVLHNIYRQSELVFNNERIYVYDNIQNKSLDFSRNHNEDYTVYQKFVSMFNNV